MIECGYMEEGKCNTCAECMSCPENNKVERYQKEDMTTEEAVMYIQSIPNKIWEQLDKCEREAMEMAFNALKKQISKEPKTNFDICCQSIENMAQIIDIVKVGWTKEQIIDWLKTEAYLNN